MACASQEIEAFISGYANSNDCFFLITNVTDDFLVIRPSGNPITAERLVMMYTNEELVFESSDLVEINRLDVNSDWS